STYPRAASHAVLVHKQPLSAIIALLVEQPSRTRPLHSCHRVHIPLLAFDQPLSAASILDRQRAPIWDEQRQTDTVSGRVQISDAAWGDAIRVLVKPWAARTTLGQAITPKGNAILLGEVIC